MNSKSALVGATGIAFIVACGGTHKLGDGNQPSEGAGGDGEGAGGQSNQGGQGGDPSVGGDPGSYAGGSQGGSVGGDPGSYGGGYIGGSPGSYGGDPGSYGGGSYGGDPGMAGSYGVAGSGNYGAGAYPGGSFGYGGGTGALPGAGGQANGAPPDPGPYTPSTPGIGVTAPNADLTGSWVGYVENLRFSSGSDALSLTLSQTSPTELQGRVTVGQGSGAVPDLHVAADPRTAILSPVEGFAFTAMNGKVVGSRLVFDIAPAEAWSSMCSAQTPWPGYRSCSAGGWSGDGVNCVTTIDGQTHSVDCAVLQLCTYACRCDDTQCFADTSAGLIHFDVTLRQPYLDGSAAGLTENTVLNVHFSPQ